MECISSESILQDCIDDLAKKGSGIQIEELDTTRELEEATKVLHHDIYNREAQGVVNNLRDRMKHIEKRNAKGATIRARMKWKQFGDKCSRQSFQIVRKRNTNSAILGLRNRRGEVVNKKAELEDIFFDFYSTLYKGPHTSEGAMMEVFDGLQVSFTEDMNTKLTKPFTIMEFFKAIEGMADGKALRHDGIPVEFFKKCWNLLGKNL